MSLAARLIGTWSLQKSGNYLPDGSFESYKAFGPKPVGYLMYSAGGYMSVTMATSAPAKWLDDTSPTDAEKARSHDACFSYCGRYEVIESEQRVVHLPEAASWPHYIGSRQSRIAELFADVLTLSETEPLSGGQWRRFEIRWERADTQRQLLPVVPHRIPGANSSGVPLHARGLPGPGLNVRTDAARSTAVRPPDGKEFRHE